MSICVNVYSPIKQVIRRLNKLGNCLSHPQTLKVKAIRVDHDSAVLEWKQRAELVCEALEESQLSAQSHLSPESTSSSSAGASDDEKSEITSGETTSDIPSEHLERGT